MRGGTDRQEVGGADSEITSCFSLLFVYVYERECLRDFELFLKGRLSRSFALSQPNILSVSFTSVLSHPPLCCSDWLTYIEGGRERGTEKKKGVRQCYSLSAYTL